MKKLISLMLVVLMLFSCVSVATASAAYTDGEHLPQVYVEGLESKGVYYKEDKDMENPLFFPIDGNMMITKLTENYEEKLKKAFLAQDSDAITAYLTDWIMDCFGDIALGKDGFTMSDKVYVPETELDPYGDAKAGKYIFRYDCRLGGVDIAAELVEYIEDVKAATGAKKVELVASSYGSAVVLGLLHDYSAKIREAVGTENDKEYANVEILDSIDSILLCVPSANGVDFASELFSGNINVDPIALKGFLDNSLNDEAISDLLSTLIKTGTLGAILDDALLPFVHVALMNAVRSVIYNVFGTMPSMWSFVDEAHFYTALENVYGADYASPDHEYAGLIERITYYHENIQKKSYDILKAAENAEHNVNIICKYGDPSIPISEKGDVLSDGFVAVTEASFGATASLNGKTLPADYQQVACLEKNHNHISADRCIDASTCLLPENTWFIKNLWHGTKNSAYYKMIGDIVYNDLSVNSLAEYPQFMMVSEEDANKLVPLVAENLPEVSEEKETSWLEDFLSFFKNFFPRLIAMIKGWFSK